MQHLLSKKLGRMPNMVYEAVTISIVMCLSAACTLEELYPSVYLVFHPSVPPATLPSSQPVRIWPSILSTIRPSTFPSLLSSIHPAIDPTNVPSNSSSLLPFFLTSIPSFVWVFFCSSVLSHGGSLVHKLVVLIACLIGGLIDQLIKI